MRRSQQAAAPLLAAATLAHTTGCRKPEITMITPAKIATFSIAVFGKGG